MYKDLNYIEKRVLELEQENTNIHLGGGVIPASKNDYIRINDIRKELEDLTDGENTLIGNMAGQFEPMYKIEPKNGEQFFAAWSDELTGGTTSKTGDKEALPCFVRNNKVRQSFYVNKYKCVALYINSGTAHTNYAVGLYNLSPAHSGGGFDVSYNGVVDKINAINSASFPTYMPTAMQDFCKKKHMITWDEYGYLCLLAKKYAFEPLGCTNQCADTKGAMATPADYRQLENGIYKIIMSTVGAGYNYWRHNGKYTGIADLVGNVRTIISGIKISSGIIELIDFTDTDGILTPTDLKASSTLWQAISVADGAYIDPATVDGLTVKAYCIDFTEQPTANNQKATFISDEILIRDNGFYGLVEAKDVELKEGLSAHWKLELAGYLPFKDGGLAGNQYLRNAENTEYTALSGGNWNYDEGAGLRCVNGNNEFSYANTSLGALLAC